ncbi:MAG: glutamine-hydrolyzing GMP synthase [Planctomycetes bacterium]|nr:glutamine-hydrolyzing GMP synthase [Planctomycetota bacterium]
MSAKILVLDFGSQYNQLIVTRIRGLGVYAQLKSATMTPEEIREYNPSGIILSGGPASVYDENAPKAPEGIFDLGVPVLGICYGMQLMTHTLGGKIEAADHREYGKAHLLNQNHDSILLKGLGQLEGSQVWMSHGDSVKSIPDGFETLASTSSTPHTIIHNEEKKLFGMQFHPEVKHSLCGSDLLKNFLYEACEADGSWRMSNFLESSIEKIRQTVGETDKVILGLSGGVDSSVMALLLHKAIGDRLTCIFIDNGLLRLHEGDQVESTFKEHYQLNFVRINAADHFLGSLKGISEPEQKRKSIGASFIEVFEKACAGQKDVKWLAQGTIYPDVIESTPTHGKSETIKSHHNVGGLPDKMNLKVLEPLRELFKDEVRALGRELGLPQQMLGRHPFPGPGLGVRVLGEVTADKCDVLRQADRIFIDEIEEAGVYNDIAQAFAVLLPVNSVGVMGDGRTYENVLALRAVTTDDFMTADWYHFSYEFLSKVSNRIVNEVRGVNRVVYDVTSKPPGTIEWE